MRAIRDLCLAASFVGLVACGSSQETPGTSGGASSGSSGSGAAQDAKEAAPSVRTASVPANPCAWIPVSEVEAAVGKLAGPPKQEDGCRYTLVIPDDVAASRQEAIDEMEQLRARFKDSSLGNFKGPMANYQREPATYAVTLSVDVSGSVAGELGAAAAGAQLQSWLPPQQRGSEDTTEQSREPDGWDARLPAPYGFSGRIGHVQISVLGQAPDVPRSAVTALADRVRDRLPDLPFPADNPYQVPNSTPGDKDPCSLLTRSEAEAVLGPLAVEPYRASSDSPPLVLGEGYGCAFYAAGHHVFSIVPSWRDGQQEFNMNKGMGALMSTVLPQELVVLKGPWDEAHISGATGALLFLKGDRLLTVHYMTSSTDMRGAVKLAAQAMPRLTL